MQWLKAIRTFYQRIKRALLYFDLVFIVVVFYGGRYLGSLRDQLLPAAVAGAFAILLESLFSINDSLEEKLGTASYTSISHAVPRMVELLKRRSRRTHSVKIIASTGGTTVNTILPTLMHEIGAPLEVHMLMLDPAMHFSEALPAHWAQESQTTFNRLGPLAGQHDNVKFTCSLYDYIPCVHGVLIDDRHLFLGFFAWSETGGRAELSGAQQPHTYYHRSAVYENLFTVFETWFANAPKRQVLPASAGPQA
mgnify:CR=1 FL=1